MINCNIMKIVILYNDIIQCNMYNDMNVSYLCYTSYILYRLFDIVLYYIILYYITVYIFTTLYYNTILLDVMVLNNKLLNHIINLRISQISYDL